MFKRLSEGDELCSDCGTPIAEGKQLMDMGEDISDGDDKYHFPPCVEDSANGVYATLLEGMWQDYNNDDHQQKFSEFVADKGYTYEISQRDIDELVVFARERDCA